MNNMMIDEMIVGLVFPTRSQVPLGNGEGSQANLMGEGRLQGRRTWSGVSGSEL